MEAGKDSGPLLLLNSEDGCEITELTTTLGQLDKFQIIRSSHIPDPRQGIFLSETEEAKKRKLQAVSLRSRKLEIQMARLQDKVSREHKKTNRILKRIDHQKEEKAELGMVKSEIRQLRGKMSEVCEVRRRARLDLQNAKEKAEKAVKTEEASLQQQADTLSTLQDVRKEIQKLRFHVDLEKERRRVAAMTLHKGIWKKDKDLYRNAQTQTEEVPRAKSCETLDIPVGALRRPRSWPNDYRSPLPVTSGRHTSVELWRIGETTENQDGSRSVTPSTDLPQKFRLWSGPHNTKGNKYLI
ncbi:Hypp2561 [Branchiostoma lanceolatum]|uniref:Hypp2561 protein n=1 Tax=Branchiostoma lanceolatum TaxID=7740 RepID=A0A8K0ET62_BRALA|nr:Hypp2561 [Branchiostoma lanceolatum]